MWSVEARRNGTGLPLLTRPYSRGRWWICSLLFASTVINYIDRQTLSLLAPDLKTALHWTNTDYAALVIGFRAAYAAGQSVCGRLMDRVGARRGLSTTVAWYSMVSLLTSLAGGFRSFLALRVLLGLGESGNWPGATKVVAREFPDEERGLATAFFDSGSSIGGAIAPFIVLGVYAHWGMHAAFVVPGILGFFWLVIWRRFYRPPSEPEAPAGVTAPRTSLGRLLGIPQTWAVIVAKTCSDPVWFFIADWFPIYLLSKGIALRSGLIAVWIPFLAADLGNFAGGALSGWLVRRGRSLLWARKAVMVFGGTGILLLVPTVFTTSLILLTTLFAASTFAYGCFTTIANVLPADLFEQRSVATVSGFSGTAASIGTIGAYLLIGAFSDARQGATTHAFDPILIAAGLIPFTGMLLAVALIRRKAEV